MEDAAERHGADLRHKMRAILRWRGINLVGLLIKFSWGFHQSKAMIITVTKD